MHTYLSGLIICIAVIEHCIKIFNAFFGTRIHIFLQIPLDFPHVHRMLDNIIIVLTKRLTLRKWPKFDRAVANNVNELPASLVWLHRLRPKMAMPYDGATTISLKFVVNIAVGLLWIVWEQFLLVSRLSVVDFSRNNQIYFYSHPLTSHMTQHDRQAY